MALIKDAERILVINLGGIGDILLSVPALRALKAAYPMAAITSMVVPRAAEILAGSPYINEVVVFSISLKDSLSDLLRLLRLRRRRFDIAVNMRTLVSAPSARKMKFILDMIHPVISAGRDTDGLGYFFDVKVPETLVGQKYEMEYDLDIASSLGAETADRRIDFAIDEKSFLRVKNLAQREGIVPGEILIGIHPGGMPSRRWPIENYACLIDNIRCGMQCKFVITGTRDEASLGRYLAKISPRDVKDFCGRLSVAELAVLIKMCGLFIVGDTAPMHIAAILKRPLIALCGPGDIVRFDPRNIMPDAVVLYKKAVCAPCERYRCDDLRCLRAIAPRDVIDAALRKLKAPDERQRGTG